MISNTGMKVLDSGDCHAAVAARNAEYVAQQWTIAYKNLPVS